MTPAQDNLNELRRLFNYDQKMPLDVKEVGIIDRSGIRIHDINYVSPKGGRVTAYLVEPRGKGRFAGVVFGDWGYGTRTEFLPEAMLYAEAGAVSLSIDDPGVRPAPWRRMRPALSRKRFVIIHSAVVDLRRGIDLLLARPDVDPQSIQHK